MTRALSNPASQPSHQQPTAPQDVGTRPDRRKASLIMRLFLVLLLIGLTLSIVGMTVEGLLWLTVVGIVAFLAAAAYAALARRAGERIR